MIPIDSDISFQLNSLHIDEKCSENRFTYNTIVSLLDTLYQQEHITTKLQLEYLLLSTEPVNEFTSPFPVYQLLFVPFLRYLC